MPATYEQIATHTVTGSATTTVSFTSISAAYTDLVVSVIGQDSVNSYMLLRFNNDSGNNYGRIYLLYDGSTLATGQNANISSIYANANMNNSGWTANYYEINNYSSTAVTGKPVLQRDGQGNAETILTVGRWNSSAAINRIDFINPTGAAGITVGSTFTIYGILKA